MKQIFLIFPLVILFAGNNVHAQTDSLNALRLDTAEQQIKVLTDSLNLYKNKVKDYETINIAAKTIQAFKEQPYWSTFKFLGLPFAILLLILTALFWLLNKIAPQIFTPLIQKWVEKYEGTNQLKMTKPILIISSDEFPNEIFIKKMIKVKGFRKVKHVTLEKADQELEKQDYPIIFANNEDGKLNQEKLEKIIVKNKYAVLFHYGKMRWHFDQSNPPEYANRLNLANSRSQVYGNLINCMNYHDTLI